MSKGFTWPYRMNPGSQTILAKMMSPSQKRYNRIGFGGPKGGGKSFGARAIAFTLCWELPIVVCIVRSRLNTLKKNHIRPAKTELKQFIDAGYVTYNDTDKMFTTPSGGGVMFMHCEREDDVDNFDGIAADIYIFEEAGHFTETMMKGIYKNNRPSEIAIHGKASYPPRVLFTFNWGGKGHSVLRRWFWDKAYEAGENASRFFFIFAPLDQNKALETADPNYRATLEELPPQLRQAYLDGDPDAFAGTVFTILRNVHEVDPTELLQPYGGKIPQHWQIVGSLDAATGGTCSFGMYAITPEGKKYKFYNYYVKGANPKVHVRDIVNVIDSKDSPFYQWTQGRRPEYIVSDAFAFQKKDKYAMNSHEFTWSDLFMDEDLYLYRVKYNRVPAIMAMHTALHFEFDGGDLTLEPDLQFFEGTCEPTIKELQAIGPDPNNPEDIAHAPGDKDDAIDETKNLIMTAGSPPHPEHVKEKAEAGRDYNRAEEEYGARGSDGNKKSTLDNCMGGGVLSNMM